MTSPHDPQPKTYSHVNGGPAELYDRLAISELCKGWPVYRDASEWKNFRSLFCQDDAYVWTSKSKEEKKTPHSSLTHQQEERLYTVTHNVYANKAFPPQPLAWSQRQTIDNFIQVSKAGKLRGDFIMHRECGTLVDLNPRTRRAVGKMKATITQRFTIPGDVERGIEPIVFDVDCDCRFHFFCLEQPTASSSPYDAIGQNNEGQGQGQGQNDNGTEWKVRYVKLIYDKDKVVPVDGKTAPTFSKDALARYPVGYRYLGAAQHMLGHAVDEFLPTIQGPENSAAHRLWLDTYEKMRQWLDGEDVDLSSPIPGIAKNLNGRNGVAVHLHKNGHDS